MEFCLFSPVQTSYSSIILWATLNEAERFTCLLVPTFPRPLLISIVWSSSCKTVRKAATPHRVTLDSPQVHADEVEESQNIWWLDAGWDHIRGKDRKSALYQKPAQLQLCARAHAHTPTPSDLSQGFLFPHLTVVFISTLVALPGL